MSDELFDFGFTAVTEHELESVQQSDLHAKQLQDENQSLSSTIEECQQRLDKLYSSFRPLLENLKANPEKEYILWPNRLEKVIEFEEHLRRIYDGVD